MSWRLIGGRGSVAFGLGLFGDEGALEVAEGLAEAVFVFDEGDADEAFAVLAEGAAWGEGDFGFVHDAKAEVDGALALEVFGFDSGPDEHAGTGNLVGPAEVRATEGQGLGGIARGPETVLWCIMSWVRGRDQ